MLLLGYLVLAFVTVQTIGLPDDDGTSDARSFGRLSKIKRDITFPDQLPKVWKTIGKLSNSSSLPKLGDSQIETNSDVVRNNIKPAERVSPSDPLNAPKPCSNGRSLCEDAEEYPSTDELKKYTNMLDQYSHFFRTDAWQDTTISDVSTKSDSFDETSICAAEYDVVFPKKGQTTDNQTMLIINQENYVQGVGIYLCKNKKEMKCPLSPQGYTSKCKQMYVTRPMVALDTNNKIRPIDTKDFIFPCCCVCMVKLEPDFS